MEPITRVRYSLLELQTRYDQGDKKPLDDLMRAFKGIKELPHTDPNSFFVLAGFHGLPFKGAGWSNAAYWGGYCHHGNILFPTWHRAYLFKLEEALRSIPGCENVTLPFWDETDDYTQQYGIPTALTQEKWTLDGQEIDNPLRSYVLPVTLYDTIPNDFIDYTKPQGYETKRYPLAGVVNKASDKAQTEAHNAQFKDYDECVKLLNENIKGWLLRESMDNERVSNPIYEDFRNSLHAPNYTVFSNNTSAKQWNLEHQGSETQVSLEASHNHIHLAVGGYTNPNPTPYSGKEPINPYRPIEGASGDMGENDTSSFDPLFYFHHANIDRMFWVWQKIHNKRDEIEIIEEYPGTNTSDEQGATPGLAPNTWLNLETPLQPFKKTGADGKVRFYNSLDCVNIEKQMGYTYSIGSLDPEGKLHVLGAAPKQEKATKLMVSNLDKNQVRGSFVISASVKVDDKVIFLGVHSVLSRWNLKYCKNCQNKMEVKAFFNVPSYIDTTKCDTEVQITTHTSKPVPLQHVKTGELLLSANEEQTPFKNVKVQFV